LNSPSLKNTNQQAIGGIVLFHPLFIAAPSAGRTIVALASGLPVLKRSNLDQVFGIDPVSDRVNLLRLKAVELVKRVSQKTTRIAGGCGSGK